MSKRNFTLLIIILVVILAIVFGIVIFRNNNTGTNTGGTTGTNFLSLFNPFASKSNQNPPTNTGSNSDNSGAQTTPDNSAVKLKKVSSVPIAGYGVFSKERLKDVPIPVPTTDTNTTPVKVTAAKPTAPATEFATALRYVGRADGNIFETFADKLDEKKFTTTVIPQVYEAYFGNKATSVIMRYLKGDGQSIESFLGNLPVEVLGSDTTNTEVKGTFLPDNTTDVTISPDNTKAFYLYNVNDSAVGGILNFADGKKTQIFSSPFTEWLSNWPNSSTVTLTTKAASSVPGYMYTVNTSTKSFTEALGGINGLTTLTSPNGKLILYSDNTGSLYVYHTDTRVSDLLGVKTLSEKCVWGGASDTIYCSVPRSLSGILPDDWYQGNVSFSDQIWKINITNNTTTMLVDPTLVAGGQEFDGIKLNVDSSENYLFFVNKKDSFLWELNLQ